MTIIPGKYNEAQVFSSHIEESAAEQIKILCDQPFVEGSKIRIMPDIHGGAGCTIGTLGGGNHFIEVNQDPEGHLYLVVHSGSRLRSSWGKGPHSHQYA